MENNGKQERELGWGLNLLGFTIQHGVSSETRGGFQVRYGEACRQSRRNKQKAERPLLARKKLAWEAVS